LIAESFRLVPGLAEEIIRHARAGYPEEICGIIAGKDGVGTALYRGRNVSPTPRVAYELDAATLARQIDFEEEGLELVAIYHSHPAGPATVSPTDVSQAFYPHCVYLVCSLADPAHPSLRGFRIARGQVREVVTFPEA